jgi:hypothetical protein
MSQPWTATGERSGLLTLTAATEKRYVVRADEKLTAFVELESAICACGELLRQAGEISPKLPEYENPHSTSSNPSRDGTCLPNLRGEVEGE